MKKALLCNNPFGMQSQVSSESYIHASESKSQRQSYHTPQSKSKRSITPESEAEKKSHKSENDKLSGFYSSKKPSCERALGSPSKMHSNSASKHSQ